LFCRALILEVPTLGIKARQNTQIIRVTNGTDNITK